MYTLICYLIYGFIPKWETVNELVLHNSDGGIVGKAYDLRCEQTGRIKRKVVTNKVWC